MSSSSLVSKTNSNSSTGGGKVFNSNASNTTKQEELFLVNIELRVKKVYISVLYLTHYESIREVSKNESEKPLEQRCRDAFQSSCDFLHTCQLYAKNYPSDEGDKFRLCGRAIKKYVKTLLYHVMNTTTNLSVQQNDIIANSLAINSQIADVKKMIIKRREKIIPTVQPVINRQTLEYSSKNLPLEDKLKNILNETSEFVKKFTNLQDLTYEFAQEYSPFTTTQLLLNSPDYVDSYEKNKTLLAERMEKERKIMYLSGCLKKDFLTIVALMRSYVLLNNPSLHISLQTLIFQVRAMCFRLIHIHRSIVTSNSGEEKWKFDEMFATGETSFTFDINQSIQLQVRDKEGRWRVLELMISQLIEQQKTLATELQFTQQDLRVKQTQLIEIKKLEDYLLLREKMRQTTVYNKKQVFLEKISDQYHRISENNIQSFENERKMKERRQQLLTLQYQLDSQINAVKSPVKLDPNSPANQVYPINPKLSQEEQLQEFQKAKLELEKEKEVFLRDWTVFCKTKLHNNLDQEKIDTFQRDQLELDELLQSSISKNQSFDQEKLTQMKLNRLQLLQDIRQLRITENTLIKQIQQLTEKLQSFKEYLSVKLVEEPPEKEEFEVTKRFESNEEWENVVDKAASLFSATLKMLLESFVNARVSQGEVKKGADVNIWNEPLISSGPKKTVIFETDSGNASSNPAMNRSNSSQNVTVKDEDKKLQIKAGTLNQLVMRLTDEKRHDISFLKTFITTYQSFTTTELFFQKLVERYLVPHDKHPEVPEDQWRHTIVVPIQLRVFNVIKQWIELRFPDFDYKLMKKLNTFIDEHLRKDGHIKTANNFSSLIKRKIALQQKSSSTDSISRTINVKDLLSSMGLNSIDYFLTISPEVIANHLTMIDANLYQSIQPVELLNQAWTKNKLKYKARNIIALIDRFNAVSKWTAYLICSPEKLRTRVNVLTKFIRIGEILYSNLNNFNTLLAILAGINSSAVFRLKFTKEEVPKKSMATCDMLNQLMKSNQSFKNYRETLHSVSPPVLPYVGIYLTDLVFLDDGNPNFIEGLINFKKREMIYKVIEEIQQYQQTPYSLPVEDTIMAFLSNLEFVEEEELWEISMSREPKGKELADLL